MNVRSANQPKRGRRAEGDKRTQILEAGLREFAARGFHGTTVPEVAKAANVGTGSLYRYFASKEALVNEIYRAAKQRLRAALLDGLPEVDLYKLDIAERWFGELWARLAAFARAEPEAFRFLEMQDHTPYLDRESRALELSVLAPLVVAGHKLRAGAAIGPSVDVLIALLWGAFVGLVKAERLGYLKVTDEVLAQARAACWALISTDRLATKDVPPAGKSRKARV
jgi:AcrR family transcriptional regulator